MNKPAEKNNVTKQGNNLIYNNLKILIPEYAKYDDNKAFSTEGLEVSESIYNHTNALMQMGDSGMQIIEGLLQEYLTGAQIEEFDILHGTMIELMSSGFDNNDIPYSLMWIAVTSFKDKEHFNLEGFDEILKNVMFEAGVTSGIDQTLLIPQIMPLNFQKELGVLNVYNFVTQFLDVDKNAKIDKTFSESEVLKNTQDQIPTFYLPFFIQGEYGEVIDKIYENIDLIEEKLQAVSQLVLGNDEVVFHIPVSWIEATEDNASKMLNSGKIGAFFDMVASTNNPNTEIAILFITGVKNSYTILSLDKGDGSIRGILKIDKVDDYIQFMSEVLPIVHQFKFPLIQTDLTIPKSVVDELIGHGDSEETEISEETQKTLIRIFSEYETINSNTLFQIITGSSMTVH